MFFHQGVLEISSLFKRRLGVWQWFSSAWCSILLEGGRWFRRFLRRHWQAPSTTSRPPHLHPFSIYSSRCTLHRGNTKSDLNSGWVWQLPSRRPMCVCTVYRIKVCLQLSQMKVETCDVTLTVGISCGSSSKQLLLYCWSFPLSRCLKKMLAELVPF